MKEIELTKGLCTIVDDDNYNWLNQFTWHAQKNGNYFYAERQIQTKEKTRHIYMHRLIANAPPKMHVDHIDGNSLNNMKSNLRVVTVRQNLQNQHHGTRSSKHPGVHYIKTRRKWGARILINQKRVWLGSFSNEAEAYNAYLSALKCIGEAPVSEVLSLADST